MNESKTEKFISIMESKITIMDREMALISKDNNLGRVLAKQYLEGLQVSLDLFKKLNDR
jgi:hypothetical protein